MKISPEYILLIRCCRKTDYFNAARWCKTYWPKTKLVCLTHKDLIEALQAEELADRIIELPPGDIGKESISGMLSEIRKLAGKGCFVIPSGPRLRSQFKNIIALLPMIKPAYGSLFIKDTGELQWCNRPESFWGNLKTTILQSALLNFILRLFPVKKGRTSVLSPDLIRYSVPIHALLKKLENRKIEYHLYNDYEIPFYRNPSKLTGNTLSFSGLLKLYRSENIFIDRLLPKFFRPQSVQTIIDIGSGGQFAKTRHYLALMQHKDEKSKTRLIIPCGTHFQQKCISSFTMLPAKYLPVTGNIRYDHLCPDVDVQKVDSLTRGKKFIFLSLEKVNQPQGRMDATESEWEELNSVLCSHNSLLGIRYTFNQGIEVLNKHSNIVAINFCDFPYDQVLLKKANIVICDHGNNVIDALNYDKKIIGLFPDQNALTRKYTFLFPLKKSFPGPVTNTLKDLTFEVEKLLTSDDTPNNFYGIQKNIHKENIQGSAVDNLLDNINILKGIC